MSQEENDEQFQQEYMDDDAFFAQVKEAAQTSIKNQRRSKKSSTRVSIKEQRLSIKIKQMNIVDYQSNPQQYKQLEKTLTKTTQSDPASRNEQSLTGEKSL